MTLARSCLQCRGSKVKCGRETPICTRCRKRGVSCSLSSTNTDIVFRDEREVARRNSQRARREGAYAQSRVSAYSSRQAGPDDAAFSLRQQYDWLNDDAVSTLPYQMRRDLDSRAIDRLFADWVLFPGNDGLSPGHMHTIPALYHDAVLGSVLWHAVRALAFANIYRARDGDGLSFSIKARRSYGEALRQLRHVVQNEARLNDDRSLAALLLIDCFESMYLKHCTALGPHIQAVKYVMAKRGDGILLDRSRFALWRMANCRLQARQIQAGDYPEPVQKELINKLNLERPDGRIVADITDITIRCADARRLLEASNIDSLESHAEATILLTQIADLIKVIDRWTSSITGVWTPKPVGSSKALKLEEMKYTTDSNHPLAHYDCPELLAYPNVWFAYIWNSHAASQIVLREYFLKIYDRYKQSLDLTELDDVAQQQRIVIPRLASSALKSFPPLVGFTDASGEQFEPVLQGKAAGRFLALFAMDVVSKAELVPPNHRVKARKVVDWIHANHSLD